MRLRYAFGPLLLFGLALGFALTPRGTRAQAAPSAAEAEEQARAHFRLGRAHYDNGNFTQAGVEFEEAYRISQRAALLYNIYLAYRDANDTHKAADALRKYLQLEKDIENRGQLESRLAAMDRALAAEAQQPAATGPASAPAPKPTQQLKPLPLSPAPEAAAPPPGSETKPAPQAATAESSPRPKEFPLVPVILMGTGGAMMATSIVTGLMAVSKKGDWDDARDTCLADHNCEQIRPARVAELNNLKSSSQTLATVTDILLFGGVAVAGTGFALWMFDQGDSGESAPAARTTASLACLPGACQANLHTSF